jgi:5-formyltetrahydrofolate cyclo-ligase
LLLSVAAMGENDEQAKSLLRRRLREARADLPAARAALLSAAACDRLLDLPAFTEARSVVVYAPCDGEVDPGAVAAAAVAGGRRLYYPRAAEAGLEFVQGGPGDLRPGRFGIREPVAGPVLPQGEGTVIVVPGVAFDQRGARLGRGAGCYDRALRRYAGAVRVGLAYDFQLVPLLPEHPWDVRMHAVVTDQRVLRGDARIGLPVKEKPR